MVLYFRCYFSTTFGTVVAKIRYLLNVSRRLRNCPDSNLSSNTPWSSSKSLNSNRISGGKWSYCFSFQIICSWRSYEAAIPFEEIYKQIGFYSAKNKGFYNGTLYIDANFSYCQRQLAMYVQTERPPYIPLTSRSLPIRTCNIITSF